MERINNNNSLLNVCELRTYFHTTKGIAKAVDGVSFSVKKGETLGIIGESGCGKSVTALSILRLISQPPGKIESGNIFFQKRDILSLPIEKMRKIRGKEISMVFQDPMTSLNPVFKIGNQIAEMINLHQGFSWRESFKKAVGIMNLVGIPSAEKRAFDYPHQMSGGMRQRVMIAMALSCKPKLLIADEPTTALDVTIQAQILDLMLKLKNDTGASIILITHDMGVIAETVQNVAVMYAGKIMEHATVTELFRNPSHPYTQSLLKSIPSIDKIDRKYKLKVIPGVVPNLINLPLGCKYSNRCDKSFQKCQKKEPPLVEVAPNHKCRCWQFH